jgi:pantetheine-phosphate adenylyltransferase
MDLQSLFDLYAIRIQIKDVLGLWNAPHRKYHTESHLRDLLEQIHVYPGLSKKDRDILSLAAIFHDIVYEPDRLENEERSAQFLLEHVSESQRTSEIQHVVQIILDTKDHAGKSDLSAIFCAMDMSIVKAPYTKLREWEEGIRYEYSHLLWEDYKQGRTAFLESMCVKYPENAVALKELIDYVQDQSTESFPSDTSTRQSTNVLRKASMESSTM